MNVGSEHSVSLWMATASPQPAEPLTSDLEADVAIVGAGIAGLSTAYELSQRGQTVIVVDRGAIGRGMTARTTAHLASELDDFYHELIRMRGFDQARLYLQSQTAALDRVEEIQSTERIDCDFQRVNGYLLPASDDDLSLLEQELEACRRLGFAGVDWDQSPISGVSDGRCLRFPNQARFHPLKYLDGLARCIERNGGRLFAETAVTGIEEEDGRVVVKTERGNAIHARSAVVATNSPINDWIAIHTKQAPYRTYVIACPIERGIAEDALYWDTLDPYHYVRFQPGTDEHDWLIVGGEDHKTGQADDHAERLGRLAEWARTRFPGMQDAKHVWSGQVLEPVDYVPFIGLNPGNEHVYVMTGDSGQGISNGIAGSLILRDLVLGQQSVFADAYDPGRISLKAAGEYISENVTMPKNLAEHLSGGELSSIEELQPGQGALIRQGTRKLAAYRDEDGHLHQRSATCTHAGCVVHWNAFEKCWDCPCHGSHFSVDGEPLNAPAFMPLAAV